MARDQLSFEAWRDLDRSERTEIRAELLIAHEAPATGARGGPTGLAVALKIGSEVVYLDQEQAASLADLLGHVSEGPL